MTAPDAFFVPDGARFVATGQWSRGPGYQHADPPAALLARAIQQAVADDPALRISRLTALCARTAVVDLPAPPRGPAPIPWRLSP